MTDARTRLFYGWWVVLVAALSLFLGPTPIVNFSFGVFLKPLIHEFHSSRGAISFAFTLHTITVALTLLFAGRLIDRFGPRKVILVSSFITSLILLSANFCSGRIWQLYIFHLAQGIASADVSPVPYSKVISYWFDRRRGLALGIMMAGLGLGAAVMPSAAQYLIARFGWRMTYGFSGALILLISVPLLTMFLKEKPELLGLMPDGDSYPFPPYNASDSDSGLTLRDATRTSTLWLVACAFILVSSSISGCFTHIAAVLSDQGASARMAAFATSVFGGGMLLGRVGSGYLLDKFFAPRVAAVVFSLASAAMALLRGSGSSGLAIAAAFFIGLGLGAEVDVMGYLTSRYFGLRSFGAIYGFMFAVFGLSAGLGTYLMGSAFDRTGSYAFPLTLFCVATLTGAVLMLCLGPYRYHKPALDQHGPELRMLGSRT